LKAQTTLFPAKTLRQLQTKKVYGGNDVFPYCIWKGKKLSLVGSIDPLLVEYWIRKNAIQITTEFKNLIAHAKFISK
jgi:hypothetical protein